MQIREKERQTKIFPSTDSFSNGLQPAELSTSEAGSFFWVSPTGAGSQGFGPSSTAFPGHKQGAGWKVEHWDSIPCSYGVPVLKRGGLAH